ncbi:ABC transporter [Pontibacillus halophilus JSM 076056 = DSM 19796]|uniref:ABC transporter n=1 Tax=Pontibacillus halophilus JSM 076056 = DSM 19796 TaxID=1385510 RepID=A0A0A5GJF2_9BACI|nr:ABC transporter permease [Pontibacillus halophilus]KGX92114.1 ABC transporter [Pontibacillus halophilus JSM 076056 = DSM 19796]
MQALYNTSILELKRMFRNSYFVFFSLLLPFLFYVLFTAMYGDDLSIAGTKWEAYFLVSMTCFGLISASVQSFGIQLVYDRQQPWLNWLFTHPIKRFSYFMGRILSQLCLNGLMVLLLFTVIGVWKGIELSFWTWILVGGWVWLGALPFLALGVWVSTMTKVETASGVANIVALGLAILGGLWTPVENMPGILQTITEWSPAYLYANGAWSLLSGEGMSIYQHLIYFLYFLLFMIGAMITHHQLRRE